jgi:hypothetical protein
MVDEADQRLSARMASQVLDHQAPRFRREGSVRRSPPNASQTIA